MSLTADLNIDHPPGVCRTLGLARQGTEKNLVLSSFTNEKRRAFAGTYFLTSVVSANSKKISPLRWSPWMADCISTLGTEAEVPSDAFLVAMVQTQHVMEKVMNSELLNAPTHFMEQSFQADLDNVTMPLLSGRPKVLLDQQRASVRMTIWTQALTGNVRNMSKEHRSEVPPYLDAIRRGVEPVRTYFELYLSVSPQDLLVLPLQVFIQSFRASVTLLRLATVEVEGCDLTALRKEMRCPIIMEEIARKFELVETLPFGDVVIQNNAFIKCASQIRWMKTLFDLRRAEHGPHVPDHILQSTSVKVRCF
jgi:hypothetical protein